MKVWNHIDETTITFPRLLSKQKKTKNLIRKIYIYNEKICEFEDNAGKVKAKIRKIYSETM